VAIVPTAGGSGTTVYRVIEEREIERGRQIAKCDEEERGPKILGQRTKCETRL
jgi:hypothetical protein